MVKIQHINYDIILHHVDPPSVVVYVDAECGARCDDGGEEAEDQQHGTGAGGGAGVGAVVVGVVCRTVGRRVRAGRAGKIGEQERGLT